MITSGLYQGAVVNGNTSNSPLNAVPVLNNEIGTFRFHYQFVSVQLQ